ncbi:MAG: EthD family reductase [Dehalococcoidia bacterium]
MVKLTLMYRAKEDGQFFNEDHYHKIHAAEALKFVGKYGCRKLVLGRAIEDVPERGGARPPFYRMTELYFDNLDDARRCIFSPEMTALNPDGPNYHNTKGESYFNEVEEYHFDDQGGFDYATGAWADYFNERRWRFRGE